MMKRTRHVLGISGGKDSAALAVYLKNTYPTLDIEYYTCDTGKELNETYELINNLEIYLGKPIIRLQAAAESNEAPFDHFLKIYGGFLPSSNSRWCTKKLKLDPFEKFVGNDPVISYVGIRGDEDRDGYISKKANIQSVFPFRKNIWSEDVIRKALNNENIQKMIEIAKSQQSESSTFFYEVLNKKVAPDFNLTTKMNKLLDIDVVLFNHIIFFFLKETDYPLGKEETYPLIDNTDVLVRDDIFHILETSGVGVPAYYKKSEFSVNGKQGEYSRSRSGCYFCFFQQKIEWIWLYEKHPDLFDKAAEYEKEGYTWMQNESLGDLIKPERVAQIKEDYIKRISRNTNNTSPFLLDILNDAEGEGCASCFI